METDTINGWHGSQFENQSCYRFLSWTDIHIDSKSSPCPTHYS